VEDLRAQVQGRVGVQPRGGERPAEPGAVEGAAGGDHGRSGGVAVVVVVPLYSPDSGGHFETKFG
jgi:hypothetical protein